MRNQSAIKQRATHLEEVVDDAGPLISTVQEDQIANSKRQPESIEGIREREGGEQQNLLDHAIQLLETGRALLLRWDIGIDSIGFSTRLLHGDAGVYVTRYLLCVFGGPLRRIDLGAVT